MNNKFLLLITFLKDLFLSISEVNTVTHGVSNDIDLDKNTIYPLVHIQALNYDFQTLGMLKVNFEVHILKIRDIVKIPSNDKWLRNDNELQNYNDCLLISNKVQSFLQRYIDNGDNDITLMNDIQSEFISLQFMNMLDGVKMNIELGINNNVDGCF